MTSNRPYLIRALYDWITDNGMTPHLLVNAELPGVQVPKQHIHEGRIVLNIRHSAVQGLQLDNDVITFTARFGGVARTVSIPINAVMAVYARESGQGMAFGGEDANDEPPPPDKRPTLKIVK